MSEQKLKYYLEYGEGDYEPTLHGPDGFECYLGELEDRTFSRDASPMVDRLNEQADRIAELESQVDRVQSLIDWALKNGKALLPAQFQQALQEQKPDAPRGLDQLAVPPDER